MERGETTAAGATTVPQAADGRLAALGQTLAAYLTERWQHPVTCRSIAQIPGGASRETYRVRVDDDGVERGLIFRRDPASSLIDTERRLEFRTYEAVYPTAIPVPEPILLEEHPGALERPFSLMAEVSGCQTAPALLQEPPYSLLRETIGGNKWRILGELTRLTRKQLALDDVMAAPDHPAARELDYWAGVIDADSLCPQPVAQAAIRWLRRNLPARPDRICLVHGDYRSGNFLFDERGDIHGILDWEMAHLGDPLEDLAWSLDPLWSWPDHQLAGYLLPRQQAIQIFEAASGLTVDRAAFRWWQVFASLKALAIWTSSADDYLNGTWQEPILALAGWPMMDRQNRILVDRLNPNAEHRWAPPLL